MVMNDQDIARRIFAMYVPLARSFRDAFPTRVGPSIGQFRILALIEFESVRHVTKLAERNLVSQPAMSKAIDALVQLGYVKRMESDEDRRLSELHVTTKGRASMSAAYDQAAKLLGPKLKRLSDSQKKRLVLALDDLAQVFSETLGAETTS
jgi:DNA-binding MarR family transcriptional regulator